MKRYQKIAEELEQYLLDNISKIKEATKVSRIIDIIETVDEKIIDFTDTKVRSLSKGKYFTTNKELNDYFEEDM